MSQEINRKTYFHLLWDIIKERNCEKGVRVHDLKLQASRERPTIKTGTWGTNPDGSTMTRADYEKRLEEFSPALPEILFPETDTAFTLTGEDGRPTDIEGLIEEKKTGILTFKSKFTSPFPKNNTVRGFIYPGGTEKAVIILTNLRAEEKAFQRLGRLLSKFGYTSLEMVHPYHGLRHDPKDTEMVPGERLFSSNMYETLNSFSQGISDILGGLLFLMKNGFKRIGGIGTSIGSTFLVMTMAYAHDYRKYLEEYAPEIVYGVPEGIFKAAIMNLSGGYLRDFITDPDNIEAGFVRKGLVEDLGLTGAEIESFWPIVDPMKFVNRIDIPILSVKTRQDTVLLYRYSRKQREFFSKNSVKGKNFREFYMPFPSGHYSASYFLPKMTIGIADLLFIRKNV